MKNILLKISIKAALEASVKILEIYNDPNSDFEVERKSDDSPLTKADKVSHSVISSILAPLGLPILSEEGRAIEYSERATWKRLWVVDPIDGTKEFIKKNGEFTVNIALVDDGEPILGVIYTPVTRELYYGAKGEGAFKVVVKEGCADIEQIESSVLRMPCCDGAKEGVCRVVASRSHLTDQTQDFIESLKSNYSEIELLSKGSSLKICLIAEGSADVYPRYAPTMEWDTAAGDAILRSLDTPKALYDISTKERLAYNKSDLLNPFFIASDDI
ncbi:MAG: 3'(2'),5'-bisphosphate nucleotidase CysQ [Rikenellaceae bacterium]